MDKKTKEIVTNTIESAYKLTFGQLPIVGPVLNELAFDYSSRLKQERLNTFVEKLKVYFESVDEDNVDKENVLTEDFHDLFEVILRKVSMTKSEEKIERFKSIVVGQLKSPKEFESVERYVEITSKLSEKQMEILFSYYSNNKFRNTCDEKISSLKLELESAQNKYEKSNEELKKLKDKKIGFLYSKQELDALDSLISIQNDLVLLNFNKKNNTSNSIDELAKQMNKAYGGKKHDELNLSSSEYEYLVNDLSSMFLLEKKFTGTERKRVMHYFVLTDFGEKFMEFIEIV